jgi:hypothetical protein
MSAGLQSEMVVLKPKAYEKGGISYIIILKRMWLFPKFYETAKMYSPIKLSINSLDFTNYQKKINKGDMKFCDEEETAEVEGYIEELPEKIKRKIYRGREITLFSKNPPTTQYEFEMKNISKLEKKISEKIFNKALSITQILPL